MMLDARNVAQALGGQVIGRDAVLAPGPGHSRTDRSLSVKILPDEFIVHSHAGDSWDVCRDYVAERIGWPQWRPGASPAPITRVPSRHPAPPKFDTKDALAIWDASERIDGSPVPIYLKRRGIRLSNLSREIRDVLRWHPGQGCMVALWTDAITAEPRSIHRTFITPAGEKIGRKSLAPNAGCVIRLWPDEAVTNGLVVGEGIETVLSAATRIIHHGALLQPAWACGDSGHLSSLPVLSGIDALTILVDHDEGQAGHKAAMQCRNRWLDAGREVIRLETENYSDFNDLILEETK